MHALPTGSAPVTRPLTRNDYKTLALSALGGALEFYDFIIFVFFATVVGKLFFPADMPEWLRLLQTFGIFAAGYLARPLGGIVMAHFGDLLGRKRMFTLSIFLMAVPTLLMGLLPTYAQIGILAPLALLLLRVIQGAAIGGEVPGAWVFVAEHVPRRNVGYACGTLTSGLTAGILLGSLMATLINSLYSAEEISAWAWRVPFIIGGVFGLLSVYLRRWLHETPVFAELQQRKALAEELPLKTVLRGHRRAVAISMLLTWVLSAGIVVVILMTPSVLQSAYGFDAAHALKANSLAIVLLSLGCIAAGALADRFGAGRVFVVGSLLLAAGGSFAATAYVSNEKDDNLSVIDLDSLTVTATLPVGKRPRGLALSRDNTLLYICASDSDSVQVMDLATRKIIRDLPSGADPEQFALHPNDRWLYISNEDDALVTVVDTQSSQVLAQIDVGVEPEGMAVSPDGKWAINTSETTNMLHWIDTATQTLVDNTLVDQRPRHVEFNHDGSQLWASAEIGGTVSVVDVATRKIVKTLRFEIKGVHPDKVQPVGVRLTRDGKYAFVALGPANHVAVVDAKTFEVLDYLLVGRRVWHMAFNPDESLLLATNGISGDVSVIDVKALKVTKSIKVGRYPWGVVVTP